MLIEFANKSEPTVVGARTAILSLALAAQVTCTHADADEIFNNSNGDTVFDCPASGGGCGPLLSLTVPTKIDQVTTYHWNGGQGELPGLVAVSLRSLGGQVFGPFPAMGSPATNGVLANWTATINQTLPAGLYVINDSRPQTWSQNSASCSQGFAIVSGAPPGGLQISEICYPDSSGQVVVYFVDPAQSVESIEIWPWMGYQWGTPSSWNPGVSGIETGHLNIKVAGCAIGRQYTTYMMLRDANGSNAQEKFT